MPSIVFMYFIEMEMQRKRKNTHSNMINKPKVQQKKEKKKRKKAFDIVMLFQFTFKEAVYFFPNVDFQNWFWKLNVVYLKK